MLITRRRSASRERSRDAFEQLATAEHASTIKAAYAVTADIEVAREVTQDAFAELFVHWDKVQGYDKPGAWLRRVAIRKAIKVTQRDAKRRVLHARVEPAPNEHEHDSTILPLLGELSPQQRAAIYLHYYDDLAVTEVAEILGCKPATASVHLNRGRQRLGDLLSPPTEQPPSLVDNTHARPEEAEEEDEEEEVACHAR